MESHNVAIMLDSTAKRDIYYKSKLVVGVEMMPYPSLFRPLDEALGGVMGRCIGQDKPSVLRAGDAPFGVAVCYESVYPEWCAGYVKAGAQVLSVITNDAWWGDTPGYRQHCSYASLRAIETRRDIARCANTGISCIINQRGDIVEKTSWWEPAVICGEVNLNTRETFFVRTGDFVGRICVLVFFLLLLWLVSRSFIPKSLR
jgi:apolipoprotein N-acyltransferase